jgi:polar amino acid transport system permease protein
MDGFGRKIEKFIEQFIDRGGYNLVLEGLRNTLTIAVLGLIIGIVIGTLIATVRVVPKYKTLPKVLNAICSFYVGLSVVRRWSCSCWSFIMCYCRSSG